MHRKSDVGGGIASVTIQTDTSKPRQVVAAPDSGGGRRRREWVEREREGERDAQRQKENEEEG